MGVFSPDPDDPIGVSEARMCWVRAGACEFGVEDELKAYIRDLNAMPSVQRSRLGSPKR